MADFDVERVRALRAGDRGAFERLARELGPQLRGLAMKYFRSPFEQEEAVQEALLHVYKSREHIDPLRAESVGGWVLTVAQRKMIDLQRASSVRPQVVELEPTNEPIASTTPERDALNADLKRIVTDLESKLKPAWRAYFRAVFVEGRDFDEAREQLGISRLRAKYLKQVLIVRLRRHAPLLDALGRRSP